MASNPEELDAILTDVERDTLARMEADSRERAASAALDCVREIAAYVEMHPTSLLAESLSSEDTATLRRCIGDYATTLRATRTPPEQMLILVKRLVRDAARQAKADHGLLTSAAVGWAIESYYQA